MGVEFADGFQGMASVADILDKWTSSSGAHSIESGRTYGDGSTGNAYSLNGGTNSLVKVFSNTDDLIIVGAAVKLTIGTGGGFMVIGSSLGYETYLWYTTGGALQIRYPDTGLVVGSANGAVSTGQWHYIEWKSRLSNSTTDYGVWVDGVQVITPGSSIDTNFNGGSAYDRFGIVTPADSGHRFTDIVCIFPELTTGMHANGVTDRIGDSRVVGVRAAAAGAANAWKKSDGSAGSSTNYQEVDESDPDGDTTYLKWIDGTSADEDSDLYDFAAHGVGSGSVRAVQVYGQLRKTDSATREIALLSRTSGGTVEESGLKALATSYGWHGWVFQDDAAAAAWTRASVDSSQFGVRLKT